MQTRCMQQQIFVLYRYLKLDQCFNSRSKCVVGSSPGASFIWGLQPHHRPQTVSLSNIWFLGTFLSSYNIPQYYNYLSLSIFPWHSSSLPAMQLFTKSWTFSTSSGSTLRLWRALDHWSMSSTQPVTIEFIMVSKTKPLSSAFASSFAGANRYCLDKNYAGVLIIWDR